VFESVIKSSSFCNVVSLEQSGEQHRYDLVERLLGLSTGSLFLGGWKEPHGADDFQHVANPSERNY
jgi:hypothetical protein